MSLAPLPQRKIIHIDMDAFFAAVEQRDNPKERARNNFPILIIPEELPDNSILVNAHQIQSALPL